MAREWIEVVATPQQDNAKDLAWTLRTHGLRAKAMFDLRTEHWYVCVSPPEKAEEATRILQTGFVK